MLAIERRKPVIKADTIYFNMAKIKQKNYQLMFETDSIDLPKGISIYLEDLFLNTKLPISINTTNVYNFKISTDVLSANPNRFRLIFIPSVDTASSKRNVLHNAVITSANTDRMKKINENF